MNINLLKKIKQKIPSSTGIMDSSEYFKSSVLASLFFSDDDELHLIFQKRNPSIRQGSEICFPGGRFDPKLDANLLETAIRETVEEMGLDDQKIEPLGHVDTIIAPMGSVISCYLGLLKIDKISDLEFNKDEVEKVFSTPVKWFIENPPEEYKLHMEFKAKYTNEEGENIVLMPVEELGLPERYLKPWGIKNHKIYVYKTNGETIWGITAQLVKHICDILKDLI